jgi:hypothetical protein
MFAPSGASVVATRRHFVFRYRSAAHWLEIFKTYYGPVLKAFAALSDPEQAVLEQDLTSLIGRFNRSGDGTMVVPSEYREVVILRH